MNPATNAVRKNAPYASFSVSLADAKIISRLANRAVAMAAAAGCVYDKMDASMDLTACHANGTPLDLKKLESFDDFNFAHDAFGIRRHINRTTGVIENCFLPRCAAVAA